MELQVAMDQFLRYLENVRNYSPRTIANYSSDLSIFEDFCSQEYNIVSLVEVNKDIIQHFLGFTKNTLHNSSYATARKLRCIRSFMKYCHSVREIIVQNPTDGIVEPKIAKRLPVYLTQPEAQRMIKAVDGKYPERDLALIMIFLLLGLRVSELSNLNIDSVDFETDTLRVIGKGDKERIVPLVPALKSALENYLRCRPVSKDPALFLSYRKTRLTVRGIQKIIKEYAKVIGVKKKITPHKLRHTCATFLYSEGSLVELKEMLGHESVATTQIYAHTNADQIRKLAEKNPLLASLKNDEI